MVVPLAMENGEICTGQVILQPISLKSDRLLGLVKELHFYAGNFNQVVIGELFSLPAERHPIDGRKHRAFNMGDEKAGRAAGNYCDLDTGFADCREVLDEVQGTACGCTGEHLNC